MSFDVPPGSAFYPESPRSTTTWDYSYTHDDGIKESFMLFSFKIYELDKQLGKLANECLRLGRVAGLLLAIKSTREMLGRTREAFFRNAAALQGQLYDLARRDSGQTLRDPSPEHYFISARYFLEPTPTFDILPIVLEELAQSFSRLHVRIEEYREFTDEGMLLKSLLMTLERDVMYRASCAKVYSDRLNTPTIQRYVHQFTDELGADIEKLTSAVSEFAAVGISAIAHEQRRSSQNLTNILTVSAFFSGVTASTLQMAIGTEPQTQALMIANMLWFGSLVFSVGAALNSLLAMAWKETRSGSRGGKLPFWVTMWIEGSQLIFLGISIVTFSAGLAVFSYSSSQASYTPIVTVAATGVTFIGLIAILVWMAYEEVVSPVLKSQANIIQSSRDSVLSNASKTTFGGGITGVLSLFGTKHDDLVDTEAVEDKSSRVGGASPVDERNDRASWRTKLQDNVKNVSLLGTAISAFVSARDRHKRVRPTIIITNSSKSIQKEPSTAATSSLPLILPTKPHQSIDLTRYGTIRDVAYSEDGKWFAVTCAKDNTHQSWTGVYKENFMLLLKADTWHEGRVISQKLVWSPSCRKLIIKFEHRFDVWDLDANTLQMMERYHNVKDVTWSFLVAEHSCVIKMNLNRTMAVYRFDHMHLRAVAHERKNNYLVLIGRIARSQDDVEPASGRSEKRLIVYDMDKRESVYQAPVLENISGLHIVVNELDMLVTHKDEKAFQIWSLDAAVKGNEITARLRKKAVAPHFNPADYVGPTRLGGNNDQYILSATSASAIDIWRRDTGLPYQRFEAQELQEDGLRCFSWRRSKDRHTVFATAGINSHNLHIWRAEESKGFRPYEPIGRSSGLWQKAASSFPIASPSMILPGQYSPRPAADSGEISHETKHDNDIGSGDDK